MSSQSQNGSYKNCYLCKTGDDDEYNLGGLKRLKHIKAHYFCLLLSQTIKQSGKDDQGILGFMPFDIRKEVSQSRLKVCCYCNQYQATLGCEFKGCKRKYHLPCGLANGIQPNYESFTSFCHVHKKSSNVPKNIQKNIAAISCMICLENFEQNINFDDVVGAECCQVNAVMHINCLKRLSASAGYFTKCPCCNNQEQFIALLKSYGVFVPEQDASWEVTRNAFSDLYKINRICSINPCVCPKGSKFHGSRQWKILMCTYCGSFGSHVGCSTFKINFVCETCSILTIKDVSNNESPSPSSSLSTDQAPSNLAKISNIEISNLPQSISASENLNGNENSVSIIFNKKPKRAYKKRLSNGTKRITRRSAGSLNVSENNSSENLMDSGNKNKTRLSILFKKKFASKHRKLKNVPKRLTRSANDLSIPELYNGRFKDLMKLRSRKSGILVENKRN